MVTLSAPLKRKFFCLITDHYIRESLKLKIQFYLISNSKHRFEPDTNVPVRFSDFIPLTPLCTYFLKIRLPNNRLGRRNSENASKKCCKEFISLSFLVFKKDFLSFDPPFQKEESFFARPDFYRKTFLKDPESIL